ncbi:TPA: hypothetical protein ACY4SV_002730 [Clostridium perfringens]|nr:hypothetical protein [Clostridium perfringens]HAT4352196.1 hypothetical protein [Clostridium perfringens]HBI6898853.1 hypothetical protein [Clostridium perfringens]HBI6919737.1 hypothetical protein [Clostridium perfringens]HBI7039600.1 hypothetical protein [Clostridium perfringens]
MVIKRWNDRVLETRGFFMKKFSLDMIKNKKNTIISSKEALKDVEPFDWNLKNKEKKVIEGNV